MALIQRRAGEQPVFLLVFLIGAVAGLLTGYLLYPLSASRSSYVEGSALIGFLAAMCLFATAHVRYYRNTHAFEAAGMLFGGFMIGIGAVLVIQ